MRNMQLAYSFDVLDQFHDLLQTAANESANRLQAEYDGLSSESFECESHMEAYKSYLDDDFYQLAEAKKLGQALAITGLYRQVETQVKRALRPTFPEMGKNKIEKILLGIPQKEIDSSKLVGFDAINELRMLNNLIKHADSRVDKKLATAYPTWIENSELHDLDKAYDRLKPLVEKFIHAFINEAYDRSDAFEAAPAKN